jgi:peptidyl-prolyl cis-trans isomerase D
MKKDEVSPVMQTGNKLAVMVLDDIYPPRQATLSEVEQQVRDKYAMDQATRIASEKAKKAADLLKSNGGNLEAAAKAVGAEVKTSDAFNRNGAVEGLGSASYFGDLYAKQSGFVFGPMNAGPIVVVGKLLDKEPADMSKFGEERASIVEQIKSKKAQERSSLFQDSILNKLIQEKKVKIHRDVINRLLASYRNT